MAESNSSVVANRRRLTGTVISDKSTQTITVRVERQVKHALYGKFIRRSSKLHAHDDLETSRVGDVVVIQECRPRSKTKSWELVSVVEAAADRG